MARINIGTVDYYYELHGSGEPLVLVAGYSCDHRKWQPILNNLTKHFKVLIFDNRAIGQTHDNNETITAEIMAHDTMALIDKLGIKMPNVVGHSMGGNIVQAMAIHYPGKLKKIAIMQSSSKWRQAMLKGLKSLTLMQKENVNFDTIFTTLISLVFGEDFLQDKNKVLQLKEATLTDEYPQSIAEQERQFNVLEHFNTQESLSKITVPTLVGYGIEDVISLPFESELIANAIQGSKLISFSCGHDAINEMPDEFSKSITQFMQ